VDVSRARSVPDTVRAATDRLRAVPVTAVLVVALLLTVALWAVLQRAEPYLGHDESVYAGKARALATGVPTVGWMVYRPLGLPLLGSLGLHLGGGAASLRRLALVLGVLTVLVVHAVAARVTTRRRAAVAVLVVVSGATFIRRLPEFLDDIPSAGLLLLTAYLVLRSRRPGGRWALPVAAVTGVLALLVRYGAAAGLITIAAAAVVSWGPRVWLRAWRELLGALAVLAAGLAPLAVYGARMTGSPIGPLLRAEDSAHRAYLGEGLVYYLQAFPWKLAGVVGAVALTAALAGLVGDARRVLRARTPALLPDAPGARDARAARRGPDPADTSVDRSRERLFLGLAAVGELLLLGLVAHGESRFALFTVMTLVILGVDAAARWAGGWRTTVLAVTAATAVAATGVTSVLIYHQAATATQDVTAVARVATQLRTPAGPLAAGPNGPGRSAPPAPRGRPCLVITRLPIEAAWASGCDAATPDTVRRLPATAVVYVITFPAGPGWSGLDQVRALAPGRSWTMASVPSGGRLGAAVVATSRPVTPSGAAIGSTDAAASTLDPAVTAAP
jgi:hypothetical protein